MGRATGLGFTEVALTDWLGRVVVLEVDPSVGAAFRTVQREAVLAVSASAATSGVSAKGAVTIAAT
jgi:hypothetical protein